MKPLLTLSLAAFALFSSAPIQAQQIRRVPAQQQQQHGLVHRCVFNRPCNWTGHATIATGIVYGLHEMQVPAGYAFAASALVFVGKEIRDHAKWGNVLGTFDSNGDLLSGVLGAYVGYELVKRMERRPVRFHVASDGEGAVVGLELKTR